MALSHHAPQLPTLPPTPPAELDGATLSVDDYRAIRAHMPTRRDLLVLMGLFATGLRGRELLSHRATVGSMAQDGSYVSFTAVRGKRRPNGALPEYERFYLPPTYGILLKDWVQGLGLRGESPLFPGRFYQGSPRPYSLRNFEDVMRAASTKALGRSAHPHLLRELHNIVVQIESRQHGVVFDSDLGSRLLGHSAAVNARHYQGMSQADKMHVAKILDEFV